MPEPVLEVENLTTHIQLSHSVVQAVGNVSFSIAQGETLGLVGESGCGKSITGLSIMRLLPNGGHVVEGAIRLDGRDLAKLSNKEIRSVRGNEAAMIFQDSLTSLNPTMPIGRQIAEQVRKHRGVSKAEAVERAAESLGIVGFANPKERLRTYPHQLSGGQRQRVMIAMALSCEPKLLIADEPTTALDVTIQAQILGLLDDLKEHLGMAVLLVTHDMGVVAGRSDRVNVMYAGRIVETAPTVELFTHMHHPYTQALLGSIPLLTQDRSERLYSIPGIPPDLTDPPKGCRFALRCSRATAQCHEEEPSLEPTEGAHRFACWHPVDGPLPRVTVGGGAADSPPLPDAVDTPSEAGVDAGVGAGGGIDAGVETASPLAGTSLVTSATVASPDDMSINGYREGALVASTPFSPPQSLSDAELLVVDHVVREYPVTAGLLQRKVASVKAVSDVSFTVGKAQTFGLVGESGCGKTTLGKLIVALETADGGSVKLRGTDVTHMSNRRLKRFRKDLQMMFQDPIASLDPRMRVGAILREPMSIQGTGSRHAQDKIVNDLLGEVGLPANAVERFPHEFSGGQRQRIGLARALTLNPQVIVADEPVSALDVSIRSQVLNLMRRLQTTYGLTYVVISHDLAVIKYLSDRIGVMYLGKLVEVGSGEDIYHQAAHHYTAGLISAVPEPDPTRERDKTDVGVKGELPSALTPPSGCRFRTRCPAAQEICAVEEPPLRLFHAGHFAACHFPLVEPAPVESGAATGAVTAGVGGSSEA